MWMRQKAERDGAVWRIILGDLLDRLALGEQQTKRLTDRLDVRIEALPAGWLLRSIPGVGPRTAEAVLAYTDEVRRFGRGKQFSAYFGVTPRLDESGLCRRVGHISQQGPSVVRWLIVECVWRAIRHSPALRAFYERVMHGQVQRRKIAIVATARKMLTIMRAMLMTGAEFNERLVSAQVGCAAAD